VEDVVDAVVVEDGIAIGIKNNIFTLILLIPVRINSLH